MYTQPVVGHELGAGSLQPRRRRRASQRPHKAPAPKAVAIAAAARSLSCNKIFNTRSACCSSNFKRTNETCAIAKPRPIVEIGVQREGGAGQRREPAVQGREGVFAEITPSFVLNTARHELKVYTPFKKSEALGLGSAPSTAEGHTYAFGNTAKSLRRLVFGLKQIGDPSDRAFDRTTGEGFVPPPPLLAADADAAGSSMYMCICMA